jgi:adenylate kinase family enzyme
LYRKKILAHLIPGAIQGDAQASTCHCDLGRAWDHGQFSYTLFMNHSGVSPAITPRRIHVVGCSGAGKTTFARELAARLGVPHGELDWFFWDANWTHRDAGAARALLADFLAGDGANGWVVDGNWISKIGNTLDEADTIVWLDFPLRLVMARVIRRTLLRGLTRRELWHGNRERLGNIFSRVPEQNIILWAWQTHGKNRERYGLLAGSDSRVVRLATPRAARRWLESCGSAG